MRNNFTILHPNMKIAVIKWSDGSMNKFHAEDEAYIDDFIVAKTEAHEGITHEKIVMTLRELLDNEVV